MGAISALQHQVQALERELAAVRAEILKYKYRSTTSCGTILATSHAAALLASPGDISVAAPPPITTPTAPASSSSSMYTAASSSTDYSSITNENIPYFR
ncbi:putative LOB domain-containing protein 15 [Cocos nucifera]|uniref:Putative LOB domain-containing protein 15 n=1 Tax=Cocos nucifera TaxID=13894 RepID=A0A8K0NED9_COCNU|nr:putative LOB domain-containing protein 15 [Cocos nucifera]